MVLTPRGRARPSPAISPWRRREHTPRDKDDDHDEALYVVTVRSAKNLKREGFRGLTNPYCQLNVGRQGPFTTDVVFDTCNPSWEHKRQTFRFRKADGPQEEKLSLACFNSGDVPELIGRLSVALSPAKHKIISLPMFRKDLGGSQVWAGSVEIELHYVPEGEKLSPADSGCGEGMKRTGSSSSCGKGYTPISPCSTSLASSFAKAALMFPEKTKTTPGGTVHADLLALSPRTGQGAEVARAARIASAGGGGTRSRSASYASGTGNTRAQKTELSRASPDGSSSVSSPQRSCWKPFFGGAVCAVMMVLGTLWVLGDPMITGGLGMSVLEEDGGSGRQTFIVINGPRVPKLADRHLVVVVGDLEVCRGGVPAPSPPTEGSSWAYDLWTKDTVSTAAAATANAAAGAVGAGPVVASGKGRSKRGSGEVATPAGAKSGGDRRVELPCGRWCSFVRWQSEFFKKLAAPLYAAKHGHAA